MIGYWGEVKYLTRDIERQEKGYGRGSISGRKRHPLS